MFKRFIVTSLRLTPLFAVLFFAACVPVDYAKITSPAKPMSVLGTADKTRLTGKTQEIEIRTVTKGADGKMKEVTGAACSLTSDELRGAVVTPQKAIAPTFKQRAEYADRGLPSGIVVDCKAGALKGRAINIASEKQGGVVTGGGLGVALVSIAVSAAIATSTPWDWQGITTVELQ
jgi:hypothetical protein